MLKQRYFLVVPLLFFLTACATITEQQMDSDHKMIYGIDCSGKAVSMQVCYKKAAALCPSGYTELSDKAKLAFEDTIVKPAVEPVAIGTTLAESLPGVRKGITIKCSSP